MEAKELLVRDFYAARARRDWSAVRSLLADDVVWHEAGSEDYSGDHLGGDDVTALLRQLVEATEGTFSLEPVALICTAEHVAAHVRWSAERRGRQADGQEIAVFRVADGTIAEAWFFTDGFEPEAHTEVFSLTAQ